MPVCPVGIAVAAACNRRQSRLRAACLAAARPTYAVGISHGRATGDIGNATRGIDTHCGCDMAICRTAWAAPPCLPAVPLGCQVRVSNILHFLNPINLQVQEMRAGPYAALSTPPPPLRVHTRTRTQTHAHQPWWLGVSISSRASPGFAFASAIAGLGRHQVLGVVVPCGGQHEAADRVCRPRRRTARPLAR